MNEKEMLNLLKDEDFIKELVQRIGEQNFYVTDKKPIYSLRECLETIDERILNSIYECHKKVISKNIKKKPEHKEIIDVLEKEILNSFREFMFNLNKKDINLIKEVLKNKKTKTMNINFVCLGYMFGFKEKDEVVYIIPNELLDIYSGTINWRMLVHSEDYERIKQKIEECIENKEKELPVLRYRIRKNSGKYLWVEDSTHSLECIGQTYLREGLLRILPEDCYHKLEKEYGRGTGNEDN